MADQVLIAPQVPAEGGTPSLSAPGVAVLVYEWTTRLMGSSIRAITFVRALAESGWRVRVITATPPDQWPDPMDGVRVHHVRSPERKLGGGISANGSSQLGGNPGWMKAMAGLKKALPLERQLSWFPALWRHVPGICQDAGTDVFLSVIAPNVLMPIGHHLARKLGLPHVIDLRDDFADRRHVEPVSASYQSLLNGYGHHYLRKAAAVSVVSPITRDRLAGLGIPSTVILNGYVGSHFQHLSWEAESVPTGGPLQVTHLGWLGAFRSIKPLLEAVGSLSDPEAIRIEHYGLIDPSEEALLRDAPCPAFVRPQVPHREAVTLMAKSDVLLAIPGNRVPAALTGKLFEYLRTRRPILLIAGPGAARDLAQRLGIRSICSPDDAPGIRAELQELLRLKRSGQLRATSDPAMVRDLDRDRSARSMVSLLQSVVQS